MRAHGYITRDSSITRTIVHHILLLQLLGQGRYGLGDHHARQIGVKHQDKQTTRLRLRLCHQKSRYFVVITNIRSQRCPLRLQKRSSRLLREPRVQHSLGLRPLLSTTTYLNQHVSDLRETTRQPRLSWLAKKPSWPCSRSGPTSSSTSSLPKHLSRRRAPWQTSQRIRRQKGNVDEPRKGPHLKYHPQTSHHVRIWNGRLAHMSPLLEV